MKKFNIEHEDDLLYSISRKEIKKKIKTRKFKKEEIYIKRKTK